MDYDNGSYTFPCPHCGLIVQVRETEINCGIFRHAAYKDSMTQLNPHAPKELCDSLSSEGKVYGCAKPYEMYRIGTTWAVRSCAYK